MDPNTSAQRLEESVSQLHRTVRWIAEPSFSLNSWGARILIAGMVALLLVSIMALISSKQMLNELSGDRATRTDRTCLILTKLKATPEERTFAGCP
jgi:uncharacterized protein YutE (UPF0331/DUF86 family)